jgi:hypothetical protein
VAHGDAPFQMHEREPGIQMLNRFKLWGETVKQEFVAKLASRR